MLEKFLELGICPIILKEDKKQKGSRRYVSLLVSVTRLKNKNFAAKIPRSNFKSQELHYK
jgi:hypothetical protein